MKENFGEWLRGALDAAGVRPADINVGSGTIYNILNGVRDPGPDVCRAIAHALRVPEEFVFRRAGLLSPLPGGEDDRQVAELCELIRRLPVRDLYEMHEYALWRLQRSEARRYGVYSPREQKYRLNEDREGY